MTVRSLTPARAGRDSTIALLALLAGGIAIGGSPIFVRLSELGPITTAVWRLGLALIPFGLWAVVDRATDTESRKPERLGDFIALAVPGVMLAADLAAWHLALHETSVANATLLSNMAPIFVTIGSWFFFRTAITARFTAGLVIALVGVIVLKGGPALFNGNGSLRGDLTALVAAMFYAGYILGVGRLRRRFDTLSIMLWTTAAAGLTLLPVALVYEPAFFPTTLFGLAMLFGIAWISHAGGQGMITYALAWLSPAFSSLTLLIQPVVAGILAWLVLAEPIGAMQAIGGIVVLAGIVIARRG
ncbi:drug/metabolite transporter (DMT)-like permease [Rhodoligotrophos appendicifer]|uniref:DMT family transporter n=1 Tax=Rhodoligotrophos appendicifer TaxID=987056 RepID=UPI001478C245|nr:DMT family transporter [Rhodoligotrophos appendicifer]